MANKPNNPEDGLKENVNNPGNPGGAPPTPDQECLKEQDKREQGSVQNGRKADKSA